MPMKGNDLVRATTFAGLSAEPPPQSAEHRDIRVITTPNKLLRERNRVSLKINDGGPDLKSSRRGLTVTDTVQLPPQERRRR
jgi:hypothetical protein